MAEGKVVFLCATMDTKADEAFFLKQEIERYGHTVKIIDVGLRQESPPGVFLTQREVAGQYFENLQNSTTRSDASSYISIGLQNVISQLYARKEIDALISVGGSGGAALACSAMHMLPIGFPKVIVTPIASGDTSPYLQGEDILLINTVVDIQNLNFISEYVLRQAAGIMDAMLKIGPLEHKRRKSIAITSFGVTTPCVNRCVKLLQAEGYEVFTFASRGISGGKIMEKMIREDYFTAVLDLTTSELTDEVCGGIYSSGNIRLRGAVEKGIPYVVVPGALEMINLGPESTILPHQRERVLYQHSPGSVKMRATASEMGKLAELFIERLSPSTGNVRLCIPCKGFSDVDRAGKVFYDPKANEAFIKTVQYKMPPQVKVELYDYHINDEAFADILIKNLLKMIAYQKI